VALATKPTPLIFLPPAIDNNRLRFSPVASPQAISTASKPFAFLANSPAVTRQPGEQTNCDQTNRARLWYGAQTQKLAAGAWWLAEVGSPQSKAIA